jgi:hypothetical protein
MQIKPNSDVPSQREQLRIELTLIREQLIERLAVKMNGGDLALLGSVGAALTAARPAVRPARRSTDPEDPRR